MAEPGGTELGVAFGGILHQDLPLQLQVLLGDHCGGPGREGLMGQLCSFMEMLFGDNK